MTKHDMLPFKMIVERGRLVPAESYDAERLDTWRNGTRVNVIFARDGGRVMERKWWAILNRAVKECKTPWKTANEASEAIKLAIGVVNLTKTVGGEFMAYPKSLTELEDPELDEAVEQMVDVVHRITGVDPEEWKKQVSHIRDEKSSDTPADDNGSGDATTPGEVAAGQSEPADEAEAGAGDIEARDEPDASPASDQSNGQALLIRIYQTMQDCVGPSVEDFNQAFKIFDAELATAPDDIKRKAENIRTSLEFCCGEKPMRTKLQARSYLAGIIGVEERELD